ncbi:MAG: JAB domain-containing protein [Firmicutes bacterium]|nr:JAB domain-containing protein [Bacillota bacterium]
MHEGHRDRLKRRFVNDGLDNFEEHNVLELLLFYGIPYKDTNEIAHRLLDEFGSISGVFDAPIAELARVEGVGEHTAALIAALPEVFARYRAGKMNNTKVCGAEKLADFAAACFDEISDSRFLLICVDNTQTMLSYHFISDYSADKLSENLREMIKILVGTKSTAAVVAHNHISGSAAPSRLDLKNTLTISETLKRLEIRLLDSVIVSADGKYTSMHANSKKYGVYLNSV